MQEFQVAVAPDGAPKKKGPRSPKLEAPKKKGPPAAADGSTQVGGRAEHRKGEQIGNTQAESQWIVAQGLLSALTIPGAIKSSAKDLSHAIFEITIDHRAYSGGGGSYEVGPKPISFHVIMHAVGQPCLASMDSGLEAFSRNPTDGSFAVLTFQLAAFTKYLNEVFLSY